MLLEKKLAVVSEELPTSYITPQSDSSIEFMSSVLQAINSMMLYMLAAIAIVIANQIRYEATYLKYY